MILLLNVASGSESQWQWQSDNLDAKQFTCTLYEDMCALCSCMKLSVSCMPICRCVCGMIYTVCLFFCIDSVSAWLCGKNICNTVEPFSRYLYTAPSGASSWLVCMCVHAYNYVTYHQCESSKHHDQQNDHRSYQHLSGCREKKKQRKREEQNFNGS